MKVKIGSKIYDSEDVPICIMFDDQDLEDLKTIDDNNKFMVYYDNQFRNSEEIKNFINDWNFC